jgi:thiamine-phosphate pyrophosphorylase
MPPNTLRIIDANCNRVSEGLRFLEDVARFMLNNADLSRQLKTIRHDIIKNINKLGIQLISQRNSVDDVGYDSESLSGQQDMVSLIAANSKRAEEGLRVIEELAKLPEISMVLDSIVFQRYRFNIYSVEQSLLSLLLRKQKTAGLGDLYVIIDTGFLGKTDPIDAATKVINGGVKVLQLRDKLNEKKKVLAIAHKLKDLCHKSGALLIINDYLDIALAVDADGIHLGQKDLPLPLVRKELPMDKVIGCSATNLTQALKAESQGADYIAVGAIYATRTKENASVVGIECLCQIKQKLKIPIVAIGGIKMDNINEVIYAGADAIAVISAVLGQNDIEKAAKRMVSKIEQIRKNGQKPGKNRRENKG